MVIPKLVPLQNRIFIGGSINALIRLSQGLVKLGHTVTIVTGSPEPEKEEEITDLISWANIQFVRTGDYGPIKRAVDSFPRLLLRIRKECQLTRFHLIHGHSGFTHWGGLTLLAGVITKRPAIHTVYCPQTRTINDRKNWLTSALPTPFYLNRLDRVIAISKNIYNSLSAVGVDRKKISIIPPTFDDQRYKPRISREVARQLLGLNVEDQIVLFVGNLTQTKGLDILLKALGPIFAVNSNLRLVYTIERGPSISDESEHKIKCQIADLGIKDRIIELGVISNMPVLMAACDVFIVPYRNTDGPSDYPIAMLEAMAVGRPIIGTRVGAIPEVITDQLNGILIDPGDADDLGRAIKSIFANPIKARAMGEISTQIVNRHFSSEHIASVTDHLYQEVVSKKSGEYPE